MNYNFHNKTSGKTMSSNKQKSRVHLQLRSPRGQRLFLFSHNHKQPSFCAQQLPTVRHDHKQSTSAAHDKEHSLSDVYDLDPPAAVPNDKQLPSGSHGDGQGNKEDHSHRENGASDDRKIDVITSIRGGKMIAIDGQLYTKDK